MYYLKEEDLYNIKQHKYVPGEVSKIDNILS